MRSIRKILLYVLYAILIILIAAALIIAFKPKKKTLTVPTATNGSSQAANKAKDGLSVSQNQDGSKISTTTNPNSTSTGTSSTSTNTPSKTAPANLAATGPKETFAVFVGASILGAVVYRRMLVKKLI